MNSTNLNKINELIFRTIKELEMFQDHPDGWPEKRQKTILELAQRSAPARTSQIFKPINETQNLKT